MIVVVDYYQGRGVFIFYIFFRVTVWTAVAIWQCHLLITDGHTIRVREVLAPAYKNFTRAETPSK